MKISITTFICAILLFVQGCHSEESNSFEGISLPKDTSKTQFSDGTYLTDVRSIYFDASYYYVSDYKQSRVWVLNQNLELVKTVAKEGRGPGELSGSGHLFATGDSLFVQNDRRQSLELFVENDYDTTIGLQQVGRFNPNSRFFVRDHKIVIPIGDGSHSLSLYDYKKESVFRFGEVQEYGTRRETMIKNKKHVVGYRDRIVAAYVSRPEIEMYSFEGKLLESFTFDDIPIVSRMMEYIAKQPKEKNSYFNLVSDVSVYGDKLYLLLLTIDQNGDRNLNTIAEIEFTQEGPNTKRIFKLGNGWYNTISVNDEFLLAFDNKNGQLNRYKLRK